jgi:ribonuclease T2
MKQPGSPLRLSPAEIRARFAAANPKFPPDAFRESCYRDGELQEERVCFTKDLSPRPCSASAGACSMGTVTLLPVR